MIAKKSKTHAFAGGLCPTVGSGGHISGGGVGTLLRKYDLAADNVVDARVMDANGQILNKRKMGEDLFWAIMGSGGASFGVILAWKLKLSCVPEQVTAFTVRRKLDRGNIKLIQRWQNIAHQFPEDLFVRMILQNPAPVVKGGKKIVQISFQGLYLGTADKLVTLSSRYLP
ncbi:berberine bridge enzyme-like 22 [Coffea eugenioides]|uniref:berberine bridge enzyme-like 22 n=1 Tax=Coffea eugenioides TaxID=49369 RepID=UPI000F5D0384|nr:berberine bridge enzyme-like 22 [Coffea arabica]XP_027169231.1 berberine bridge enzyme-like 22 [Coffea eugenioides]